MKAIHKIEMYDNMMQPQDRYPMGPGGLGALTLAQVALGRRVFLCMMRYVYPERGHALTPFALLMSAVGGQGR